MLTGHTVRASTFGQPGFGCSGGGAEIGHQHPTAPSAPTLQYPAPGLAEGLRSGDETLQHTNGPRFELPATKILSPNEVDGCWFQPHGWASGLMPTDAGKLRRPGGRSPHSLLGQGSGGGTVVVDSGAGGDDARPSAGAGASDGATSGSASGAGSAVGGASATSGAGAGDGSGASTGAGGAAVDCEGVTCKPGASCVGGECVCSGLVDCGDVCSDLTSDYDNCGACGDPCEGMEYCEDSQCQGDN